MQPPPSTPGKQITNAGAPQGAIPVSAGQSLLSAQLQQPLNIQQAQPIQQQQMQHLQQIQQPNGTVLQAAQAANHNGIIGTTGSANAQQQVWSLKQYALCVFFLTQSSKLWEWTQAFEIY